MMSSNTEERAGATTPASCCATWERGWGAIGGCGWLVGWVGVGAWV